MGILKNVVFSILIYSIVTFFLMENEAKQINDSSVYSIIRASINHLCPYSNICGVHLRPDNFRENEVPCCKDCSCEETCKINGNCCFSGETDDAYEENASEKQYTSECAQDTDNRNLTKEGCIRYKCLFPGTVETFPDRVKELLEDSAALNFYNMIDMCPSVPEIAHDPHTTSQNCGEMAVASWGSLLPVFSPSTRKLYINNKCAECHNVTDGIIWNVIQTCIIKTYWNNADVSVMVNVLKRQPKALDCFQIFTYPGKLIDIEDKRCYKEVVGHCGEKNFEIPKGIGLGHSDIVRACESGFFSPIYGELRKDNIPTTYANVYCVVCNSAHLFKLCKNSNRNVRLLDSSFTYILKGSFFLRDRDDDTIAPVQKVCSSTSDIDLKDHSECRLLHCPAGQIRINRIKCQFISKYWSSLLYVVLELTPLHDVSISLIDEMTTVPSIPWLLSPWPVDWTIKHVIFKTNSRQSNGFLERWYVHLKLSMVSYNILTQLQVVNITMSKMWKIQLNDTFIPVEQKISPIRDFHPDNSATWFKCVIPLYIYFNITENWSLVKDDSFNKSSFTLRSIGILNDKNMVTINKLFYCQQVELNSTEFELTAGNRVLYYKSRQEYYFENEFTFVEDRQAGTYSVRLCASDVGFHYRPVSSNNRLFPGPMTYLTLLYIIVNFI